MLVREGDFGVVVLGRPGEAPTTLAGTGVAIWDALAHPCLLEDLIARLADTFAVEPETIRADVEPVVAQLLSAGVLESSS